MLKIVTITGADNSINPNDLEKISIDFPFVEWGLLLSRSSQGQNRFPTTDFLEDVQDLTGLTMSLNLSGHLCGSYVRELLAGDGNFMAEISTWNMFQRIQINTHGQKHEYDPKNLFKILQWFPEKEFIFQYDNTNKEIVDSMMNLGLMNISTLFDLSHGAGVLPKEWPNPIPGLKCGYAGGISPFNIEEQIQKIEERAKDQQTWIDMETHVRGVNDRVFDLEKVKTCLQLSSKFIKQNAL